MNVSELRFWLAERPADMQVTIDIDDGAKGNYKDVLTVRVVTPVLGDPFIAIDADYMEPRKGVPVGGSVT